jgi:proton-translocating NAD(P)+ transhydrogenase subunit alpha
MVGGGLRSCPRSAAATAGSRCWCTRGRRRRVDPGRAVRRGGRADGRRATGPYEADEAANVAPPTAEDIRQVKSDGVLIALRQPLTTGEPSRAIARAAATSFAMEAIPRISPAQSMDAFSSQANIAGDKPGPIAPTEIGRFFLRLWTLAGIIRPATVLMLGAAVAGLHAIATARHRDAVVQGFDVRAAVKDQVESAGAHVLGLDLGGDLRVPAATPRS